MKAWKIFFSAIVIFHYAPAQLFNENEKKNSDNVSTLSSLAGQQAVKTTIQDGPVDPKEYLVGPGDVFSVNIWTAIPLSFQIPVSPEGILVIPTVGELKVSGESLEKIKKNVLNEIRRKYITASASLTLLTPRSFTVTVNGAVLREGTYVVQATQRVEAALRLANDVKQFWEQNTQQNFNFEKHSRLSSRRNIVIRSKDGTMKKADIEKYYATGISMSNPLLADGDVIIVPPVNIRKDFVGVYGAVAREKEYEFADGDSLLLLLNIAGGLTSVADSSKIVIARNEKDGSIKDITVNLKNIISGAEPNIALFPGDRIISYAYSFLNFGGKVEVEGEVVAPGTYSIVKDSTTLSSVIAMAGGFTKFASLNAARIIRDIKDQPTADLDALRLRRGRSTIEDTVYFNNEIMIKSTTDITNADFVGLFEKNDSSKDVKLHNGDKIIIPARVYAVYVFGEVKNPGFITLKENADMDYYIRSAGGYTESAQTGDIRIIKAGSKQWLLPNETTVAEGDFIWVPKEPYRTFEYYLNVYSQMFGIIGTVATLYLLIKK